MPVVREILRILAPSQEATQSIVSILKNTHPCYYCS